MPDPSPLYRITSYVDRHNGAAGTISTLVALHDGTLTLTFRAAGAVHRLTVPLTSARPFVEALDAACPASSPPPR